MTEQGNLLDLNVLLALGDVDHDHHATALRWFDHDRSGTWGTCLLTEAGFIRVMTNGRLSGYSVPKATGMLGLLTGHPEHRLWSMSENWSSLSAPFADRIFGHQQVTDACLLGLAVKEDGVLVTMDKAIAHLAGTKYRKNLLLLDPD